MMATPDVVTKIEFPTGANAPKKIASGKVRDLFEIDAETLLFVATDRISAYDVILSNGIPSKGPLLTSLSTFWFNFLGKHYPSLRTHYLTSSLPASLDSSSSSFSSSSSSSSSSLSTLLSRRSMQVRRLTVLPLESIVRGYITGSAWAEYGRGGTVHGIAMPAGLREGERLARPIWTPSTKGGPGEKDENISPEAARELVGRERAGKVEEISLRVYELARDYAERRGIIIADTKFEFGVDGATGEIVLIDEVLTPDSSRFWPADRYEVGKSQESYDKQYLRDWLTSSGLKGKQDVVMPEEIVQETARKYREAYERLTGEAWQ